MADATGSDIRRTATTIRRAIVAVIVVSFGVAALGGIAVLLSGAMSDTVGRVLPTTALVGVFSVGHRSDIYD